MFLTSEIVLDVTKPKMAVWNKILQIILANRTPNDLSAISSLGDELVAEGHVDLGHFW